MWRFLRNRRLILRLHYYLGTHILGASRGGPCDSTALVLWPTVYVHNITVTDVRSRLSANKVDAVELVGWGCKMGWWPTSDWRKLNIYHNVHLCRISLFELILAAELPSVWVFGSGSVGQVCCILGWVGLGQEIWTHVGLHLSALYYKRQNVGRWF